MTTNSPTIAPEIQAKTVDIVTSPTLTKADYKMVEMVNSMTREIVKEVNQKNLQEVKQSDALMMAIMMVGVAVYMVKHLVMPMLDRRNGNGGKIDAKLANEAHSITAHRDTDGVPMLLSIPKMLREFTDIMKDHSKAMEKLANHNTELLKEIHSSFHKKK